MNYDRFGVSYTDTRELVDLLYQNPDLDISKFKVEDPDAYNQAVREFFADLPILEKYQASASNNVDEFDAQQQANWHMPQEYRDLDIAQWVLDQCKTQDELQRVGEELLMYHERGLFDLLRYLKYMVDTFRKNNVVWGLGRGSSVASYVLYILGVHKINSLFYDIPIEEFLK